MENNTQVSSPIAHHPSPITLQDPRWRYRCAHAAICDAHESVYDQLQPGVPRGGPGVQREGTSFESLQGLALRSDHERGWIYGTLVGPNNSQLLYLEISGCLHIRNKEMVLYEDPTVDMEVTSRQGLRVELEGTVTPVRTCPTPLLSFHNPRDSSSVELMQDG